MPHQWRLSGVLPPSQPSPPFPSLPAPDSGEQVLVDVETKSNKEIMEHVKKILGKNE